MSLDSLVRSAVATAARVTDTLACRVVHSPYDAQNAYSEATYGDAVIRRAVISYKQKLVTTTDGREVLSVATVTFLGDLTITTRDRLVFTREPDDMIAINEGLTSEGAWTSPILAVAGVLDPTTGRPYSTLVYLGAGA